MEGKTRKYKFKWFLMSKLFLFNVKKIITKVLHFWSNREQNYKQPLDEGQSMVASENHIVISEAITSIHEAPVYFHMNDLKIFTILEDKLYLLKNGCCSNFCLE
jgi:hypothetical protein